MPLGLSGESVSKLSSVWIKVAEGTSDTRMLPVLTRKNEGHGSGTRNAPGPAI